ARRLAGRPAVSFSLPAPRVGLSSGDAVGAAICRPGDSAPAGGRSHGGCAPHSLFGLAQKENAPRPVEEKKALSALRCSGPPRATEVDVSVPAPIRAGLRARLGLLPGRYCRPVADGASWVGVQGRI